MHASTAGGTLQLSRPTCLIQIKRPMYGLSQIRLSCGIRLD